MTYNFSKTLNTTNFNEALEMVTNALKVEGFGILTEIDVTATFKKKLDIDFRNYRILGACNPHFAHKAITVEPNIGVFLPCNALVQQHENGKIEVNLVDPMASMQAVENPELGALATEVKDKLLRVSEALD